MTHSPIVAIQMDPLESIAPKTDTSLLLGLEAKRRGYRVFVYTPNHLSAQNGRISARGHFVDLFDDSDPHFRYLESATLNLRHADVVLMRQDPPFNMNYITATYMLEALAPDTLVVNDPRSVRDCPEKWFINAFPEFIVPTLVSADPEAIADFRDEQKDIIIKPLYGFGGRAIFHLDEDDGNFDALLEWMLQTSPEPMVIQKFIPEVRKGDLRVVFADGDIIGQMSRVPVSGDIRSNLRTGGTVERRELTTRQQIICDALGPELKARGLLFTGIDLIGDYLVEINVTSPTGLRQINSLYDAHLERALWDTIEAKLN
ncbi:MAG: glutathione synthase [Rickettsiales bacterium]